MKWETDRRLEGRCTARFRMDQTTVIWGGKHVTDGFMVGGYTAGHHIYRVIVRPGRKQQIDVPPT